MAVLLQFVLTTIVSASDFKVRAIDLVLVSTACLILPSPLFTPAPTRFAKSTVNHGGNLGASRKDNVRLNPHATNNVPSDSVTQRTLSSDSYVDAIGMNGTACRSYCRGRGYVSAFDFVRGLVDLYLINRYNMAGNEYAVVGVVSLFPVPE